MFYPTTVPPAPNVLFSTGYAANALPLLSKMWTTASNIWTIPYAYMLHTKQYTIMKTRTTLRGLITLLLFALVWAACNDDPTPTPTPNPNPPTPLTPTPGRNPIEDTWRLVAIHNVWAYASETIDTAIYTLTFRTDSTFYGRDVSGRYTLTDSTLHITLADINEAALPQLSRRLRNALRPIRSNDILAPSLVTD